MKKLILLAGMFVSMITWASQVIVETPVYHKYDLSVGITQIIPIGDAELRVVDPGDPVASVFKLTIGRVDPNGQFVTLCQNELIVPFNSEASLVFSDLGVKIRFVATVPDATNPGPNG